jgi:thiazole synthase
MQNSGAMAIMLLRVHIGTNKGLKMREIVKNLVEEINTPIIVDATI